MGLISTAIVRCLCQNGGGWRSLVVGVDERREKSSWRGAEGAKFILAIFSKKSGKNTKKKLQKSF